MWPRVVGPNERPRPGEQARPSELPQPKPKRKLSSSELRVARWLEAYCVARIPKNQVPARVSALAGQPSYVGARRFVMKFGARAIVDAIDEMTDCYLEDDTKGDGPSFRQWNAAIVSPASYLNWYVRQMAQMQGS